MMNFFSDKLRQLGALVELADIGMQALDDGSEIRLPPVILGSLGNDPKKKTVLAYCHLDVQPAAKEDGWDYDPFDVRTRCWPILMRSIIRCCNALCS